MRSSLILVPRLPEFAGVPPKERARLWRLATKEAYRRDHMFSWPRGWIIGACWAASAFAVPSFHLPNVVAFLVAAFLDILAIVIVENIWMRRHVVACLREMIG